MTRVTYHSIEDAADGFLRQHHPSLTIPIPVEEIVELQLGLNIVTDKGLLNRESIDAFLSSDLKELHIDEDHYMGRSNRGRFTLAHELGHLVLHKEIVLRAKSIDDWKRSIMGEGTERDLYESQANDFAGCLLMPRAVMLQEFEKQKAIAAERFKASKMEMPEEATLISFLAKPIGRAFDVSEKTAEIRLEKVRRYPRQ